MVHTLGEMVVNTRVNISETRNMDMVSTYTQTEVGSRENGRTGNKMV